MIRARINRVDAMVSLQLRESTNRLENALLLVVVMRSMQRSAQSRFMRSLFSLMLLGVSSFAGCKNSDTSSTIRPTRAVKTIPITTASGIEAILVPQGSFQLGSGEGDEGPRRAVTISPLVVDKYEVQQSELAKLEIPDASHFKGERRPVEMIRWSEATLVCNARSRAEGLEPCYDEATFECNFEASGYRLPTEAEWEYVARAGDDQEFVPGRATPQLDKVACYAGNSSGQTMESGSRDANAWGFHDLLGNVAEWCNDIYSETAYASAAEQDPTGPTEGDDRVLRGGSWKLSDTDCRVTARFHDEPGLDDACFARDSYGFRMVRRPSETELSQLSSPSPQP